jgi:hypothetical protein
MRTGAIFAGLSALFTALVLWDGRSGGHPITIKQRTWLLVAAIFALVSAALQMS